VVALNEPAPLALQLTVPVGVVVVPLSLSITVAVQVDAEPAPTEPGTQATLVVVVRGFAVTLVVPLLVAWLESPL